MNWWSCHINRKDSFFLKLDTVYRKHLESANLHKNTVQCLEENMQISQNVHLPNILSTSSRNFFLIIPLPDKPTKTDAGKIVTSLAKVTAKWQYANATDNRFVIAKSLNGIIQSRFSSEHWFVIWNGKINIVAYRFLASRSSRLLFSRMAQTPGFH